MRSLRHIFSFLHCLLAIGSFLVVATIAGWIVPGRERRMRLGVLLCQKWCRYGLRLMRVRVNVKGAGVSSRALYVGNHVSYLDILVLAAHVRTCFVTSVEIRETPVLGQLCELAGCVFVERRNKSNIHAEIGELTAALRGGLNVTVFPEATSTNGEQILRFRKPLFTAAREAETEVVPFCLNYRKAGVEPLSFKNRDDVFWYGDMDFLPHLWRLIGLMGIEVDLVFTEPLASNQFADVSDLAGRSQKAVEQVFQPVKALRGVRDFELSNEPAS